MTDGSCAATDTTTTCCAACLLPPRPSPDKNGELIPLLRCSRCQEVWYHDVTCQRNHYPIHKQFCLAHSKKNKTKKQDNSNASNSSMKIEESSSAATAEHQFVIEERPGRGRCMIAARMIPKAQPIFPTGNTITSSSSTIYFEAMVPPVLLPELRDVQCAVCFKKFDDGSNTFLFEQNRHHHDKYTVTLCSAECVQAGTPWLAEEERLIVKLLRDEKKHKLRFILPISVYMYRVCLDMINNNNNVPTIMDTLHTNPAWSSLSALTGNNIRAYAQDALLVVRQMLTGRLAAAAVNPQRYQPPLSATAVANLRWLLLPTNKDSLLLQILTKLVTNGCTILDEYMESMGIGLYPKAIYVNHSCQPNTLQTFAYGDQHHQPPRLRLTTCSTIVPGEEICISYIDNRCPLHTRQIELSEYAFECTCPRCVKEEQDQSLVGLKCMTCGIGQSRLNRTTKEWQCVSCHAITPLGRHRLLVASMVQFELTNALGPYSLQDARRFYLLFRQHFMPSSWYYRRSAELYAHKIVAIMEQRDSNEQKNQMSREALIIFDELLSSDSKEDWNILDTTMHLFAAAKLRVFFDGQNSTRGSQEITKVRNTWLLYYPPDHEIFRRIAYIPPLPLIRLMHQLEGELHNS